MSSFRISAMAWVKTGDLNHLNFGGMKIKNMTQKTAEKYVQLFRDKGFNSGTRRCIFVPGVKVLVDCSAPLMREVITAGHKGIRNLGRHNTTLACYNYQEARALLMEIDNGKVTLPE